MALSLESLSLYSWFRWYSYALEGAILLARGRTMEAGYKRRNWTTRERNRVIRREHRVNVRERHLTKMDSITALARAFNLSTKTIQHVVYRIGYS